MTLDIILVLLILGVTLVLFVSDRLRADVVALLVMAILMVLGFFRPRFATPAQVVSGFSNTATITIGAILILSHGLVKTGSINWLSRKMLTLGGESENRMFLILIMTVGFISAFLNNTAAVAIFLPVTLTIAARHRVSASKYLIPLSYISMIGGSCTLIGTSTNILVSSMAQQHGYTAFGMFEVTRLGVIFFVLGIFYLFFIARHLLPPRASVAGLTRKYSMGSYLTGVIVNKGSALIGKTLVENRVSNRYDVNILEIIREDQRIWSGLRDVQFQEGDLLLVRGSIDDIVEMNQMLDLSIRSQEKYAEQNLDSEEATMAEAVISPSSNLIGRNLKEARFRQTYGVFCLAIRKHGKTIRDKIGLIRLDVGDTLLVQGRRRNMELLGESANFLVLHELKVPAIRKSKAVYALAIFSLVVLTAALGIVPIMASSILGCLALILTGCLTIQEAYEAIDWFVIFLLAGMIPLGLVMESTGTAQYIASGIMLFSDYLGPVGLISGIYLLTTILTSVISNQATAILFVPIAFAAAEKVGISPMPLLMAITFAASSSLSTPFGYHTNLMIYGPGAYRFSDYMKAGIPLNLAFWALATLLIPLIWPP